MFDNPASLINGKISSLCTDETARYNYGEIRDRIDITLFRIVTIKKDRNIWTDWLSKYSRNLQE